MRLYPDLPRRRASTLAGDLLVLALLALFAWLGLSVHDSVDDLATLGQGVQSAGRSVEGTFDRAAEAVEGVPLVGGQVGDALRGAGRATGGEAARLGTEGEDAALDAATRLGWVTFLVPAILLVTRWLPARVGLVRQLTAAHRALREPLGPERRLLLAQRAAFGLPYATLARHTRDPFGDLAAGRLDPLVAAAREDAGLRSP
jgi:hypothetical protein